MRKRGARGSPPTGAHQPPGARQLARHGGGRVERVRCIGPSAHFVANVIHTHSNPRVLNTVASYDVAQRYPAGLGRYLLLGVVHVPAPAAAHARQVPAQVRHAAHLHELALHARPVVRAHLTRLVSNARVNKITIATSYDAKFFSNRWAGLDDVEVQANNARLVIECRLNEGLECGG